MRTAAADAHETQLVLGRYRPLKPLGTGGNGSVWLARDERSGLDVALKIVPREGKAGVRAEREAKAAASLRHPRCIRSYALGRDASHVYIAYEYVPGRTLREAMRSGELDDRAIVEVAAQILEGLAHAHRQGIVHRDVKPANVLLADGTEPDARLLDFGLALMTDEQTLTARGDVPGTLAYISPERLNGEPARPAADVWAVGVILWEALTGRHPFWDGSPMQVQQAILDGAPALEELRPDLPRPVHEVVASALLHNPSHRPAAEGLAAQLRDLVRRERRSSGGGGGGRVAPPIRVHAVPARLPAAALAAVFAGWTAGTLPFYPHGWAAGLAAAAALATLVRPRLGLLAALAVPFFPLANVSLGLGIAYAAIAAAWIALTWRDPRAGLLVAAGPALAPLAALGLLPLVAQAARGPLRKAATAAVGVLLAAIVAGIRGVSLPFGAGTPPLGLGIAGSERPLAVLDTLWRVLAARPGLLAEAVALALLAAAIPFVRARGPWTVAAFGAAMLASTLLAAPAASAAPLVAAAWATCGLLAWRRIREGER
ncbi:MAG TPA: serine/threonine-protein kinase [Gaiellaceae bacterium]|nr:serine/threonine-protein kinase [Gaiellaceae bacterium]